MKKTSIISLLGSRITGSTTALQAIEETPRSVSRTSEAVLYGHPDKLADSISDALLDEVLSYDPEGRAAFETLVTKNSVIIAGEVWTTASIPSITETVRRTIADAGYVRSDLGFDAYSCKIVNLVQQQSPELANLQQAETSVAGDQGIMTGYATAESPDYLPLQHSAARNALFVLNSLRFDVPEIFTDAKSLATVEFPPEGLPKLTSLVISCHNRLPESFLERFRGTLNKAVRENFQRIYTGFLEISDDFTVDFNPGGSFTIGGPSGDTGLTGRKIVVDQYGPEISVGGGAFSGKDPSKVDRSAAYYARYVAKNLVAAGLCKKALIKITYVIGKSGPQNVLLDTFGTNATRFSDEELLQNLCDKGIFNFNVADIIEKLHLKLPIYLPTAQTGPFGNEPEFRKILLKSSGKIKNVLLFPWEVIENTPSIQAVVD